MAIILGGVTLSPHMIWADEMTVDPVSQVALRTLGGRLIVRSQAYTGGRNITLEAREDQGWLTKTQVESVMALAAVAGAQYALTIESQNFTVMFRHHEAPAFEATPLIFRVNSQSGDYFTGTIRLITV